MANTPANKVARFVRADPTNIPITLILNDQPFDISNAITVRAAIVDRFNLNIIAGPINLSSVEAGADFDNGRIIVNFSSEQTALAVNQTSYYFEVEIVLPQRTETFFIPARSRNGLIT